MPMFDFICSRCDAEFEELVRNAREEVECPSCGAKPCERKLARVAFSVGDRFIASTGSSACGSCAASSCSGCSSTG